MGRLAAVCTLILGICLAALPAGAVQRVALVIGNSDYKLIPRLANPKNDAALMAETLREVGFEVIEAKNADRRGMARAIRDFGKRLRRAGPDAVGLFYYAGHGVQAAGTNYLIPLGALIEDEADLEIEAVSASWVLGQMESAGNALNVVILDACRNNPFKGSFRAMTRGLARMNAPSGSLVAYAAAPGQVAADGIADNSPYTAALAAAMKEPGLALEAVFKRVRVAVEAATGEQQTPWEESSLKGDFYFVPQGSTVTVTPPRAQPQPAFDARALDLAFWNSIEKSADPADFEDYLARYPDGAFSGLAKRRLAALTKVAALPPAAATPGHEIEEIDEIYYVLKPANVRAGPGTSFEKVGRLPPGAEVGVTGKVSGKPWLRIALEGGEDAYVYGPLLTADNPKPPEPAVVEEKPQPAEKQVAVGVYPSTGALTPGKTFQDCSDCPEMVVVPPGSFTMGSPSYEEGRDDDEGPQHRVMIPRSFAVGKYEVTRGQYAVFARETDRSAGDGCFTYTGSEWKKSGSKSWRDPGFRQTDRDPVVCVSWDDAQAYVSWLNGKTEKNYRLLSESEWEYVARAGTSTARYWGESSSSQCDYANVADRASGLIWATSCNDGESHTSPVGKYRANEFGLHDVLGNIWEWVEDCWNDSYAGAPSEGTAWVRGDCTQRVLRGGSWGGNGSTGTNASGLAWLLGMQPKPEDLRTADRYELTTGVRSYVLGFRVARTL